MPTRNNDFGDLSQEYDFSAKILNNFGKLEINSNETIYNFIRQVIFLEHATKIIISIGPQLYLGYIYWSLAAPVLKLSVVSQNP